MKTLAKILASLCVLVVIITIPLTLLAFDFGRVVFNPPLVKSMLTEEVVNSDLLPIALEWFSDRRAQERVETGEALTGITEPDIVLLMSYLDREDWRKIKQEVLTDPILTDWVSVSVDGTYAWIDSTDRVPQITWSMQPFKDRVNTEHGANCIVIAYSNLAPCTQEQIDNFLARLAAVPEGTEVLYNLCAFPEPWHEDQFNDYVSALHDVVENVPSQFALTNELAQVEDTAGVGAAVLKGQLRLLRFLMNWAWLIPVILLLLILLLAIRSVGTLGRWWGLPLTVGGFLTLLPALVYRPLITWLLASGPLSETPELVRAEAIRVILKLAAAAFKPLLIQAVIVTLVGVILVIVLLVQSSKEK